MSISDLENSLTALNGAVNNLDVTGLINNVQTALNNETNRAEGSENNLNNSIQTLTNSLNNVTSQIQQLSSSGGGTRANFLGFKSSDNVVVQSFTFFAGSNVSKVTFPQAFAPNTTPVVVFQTTADASMAMSSPNVRASCFSTNGNTPIISNTSFNFSTETLDATVDSSQGGTTDIQAYTPVTIVAIAVGVM